MQTGLSSWVYAIVRALQEAGVDADELMRGIGMETAKIGDLSHRYSQNQVTSLWIAASKKTGDPHFGLHVARHVRPSTFHVVGYAMSCSANLRRSGKRFARFSQIISDAAIVKFEELPEGMALTVDLKPHGSTPLYHTIDTILAGFHLLCEWIVGEPIRPLAVELQHKALPDAQPYLDVFHCPVAFNKRINRIIYDHDVIEKPIPAANEEMAHMLDEMAANLLEQRRMLRFSGRVREALLAQLPKGFPTRKKTAQILAVTERTLLRRLADERTTYQDVLENLRKSLALEYLRRPELTSEEIAYLLGFSSHSSFSRAFMRWTGQRPSEWRVHLPQKTHQNMD